MCIVSTHKAKAAWSVEQGTAWLRGEENVRLVWVGTDNPRISPMHRCGRNAREATRQEQHGGVSNPAALMLGNG